MSVKPPTSFNKDRYKPIVFILWTALIQVICVLVGIAFRTAILYINRSLIDEPNLSLPITVILIHGLCAYFLAYKFGLTKPWCWLNLLLPVVVLVFTEVSLPDWFLTALIIIIFLIYLPTYWTRVPYYPTSKASYAEVLKILPVNKNFTFIDLGSGFGGILGFLSDRFPNSQFIGVEISPMPYLATKLSSYFRPNKNLKIQYSSFWTLDLSQYNYVYAFLAPGPMPQLWQKVKQELKPGSVFITNTFDVESTPSEVIQIDDEKQSRLMVFRF